MLSEKTDYNAPFIDAVIPGGGGGGAGGTKGCMGSELGGGGGGGMASDGAPSGLRWASVWDLLSSFISAARTCSN